MAPSRKKKQRLDSLGSDSSPRVILFEALGLKPDVRFKVFDNEFHLHSTVLKLHSEFFLKFLDSAEKEVLQDTIIQGFKYEWNSMIDGDGWHMVVSNAPLEEPLGTAKSMDKAYESECFEKLLRAFYGYRYRLHGYRQLLKMTEMADYYRALPVLSRSLDGAMVNSPNLILDIDSHCVDLLICAAQLKNSLLFRECLIWSVASWASPKYTSLKTAHPKLFKVTKNVHDSIGANIAKAQTAITEMMLHADQAITLREVARRSARDPLREVYEGNTGDLSTRLPFYFRTILESGKSTISIERSLRNLLENNLFFNPGNDQAGEGKNLGNFFCATIDDEDLPWDQDSIEMTI